MGIEEFKDGKYAALTSLRDVLVSHMYDYGPLKDRVCPRVQESRHILSQMQVDASFAAGIVHYCW